MRETAFTKPGFQRQSSNDLWGSLIASRHEAIEAEISDHGAARTHFVLANLSGAN